MALALDPNAQAGSIQTLIAQLLGGSSSPTGIGSSRPASLGPTPVRQPNIGAGGVTDQGNINMQSIYSLLAPYLALLGGQGGGLAGAPGSDVVTQFLTQILNSIAGIPASSAAAAGGGAPAAGAPISTSPLSSSPTSASILSSAAGGTGTIEGGPQTGGQGGPQDTAGGEILR